MTALTRYHQSASGGERFSNRLWEIRMKAKASIRNLITRPATRPMRKAQHRARLVLEALEGRWIPSVSGVSSLGAVAGAVPVEVMGPQGTLVPLQTTAPTGYTPQQLQTAYGLNQVSFSGIKGDGAGQTIALVDAYDNPSFVNSTDPNFDTSALHIFDHNSVCPIRRASPRSIRMARPPRSPRLPRLGSAGSIEIALDIEWAHAMAPAASIILVEANDHLY